MANIDSVLITQNDYSENILKKSASFDFGIDYAINSGTGIVELQNIDVFTSDFYVFKGSNSLKVTNTDYQNTDLVFSSPSGLDSVQVDAPTNAFISLYVLNPTGTINTRLKLEVFMDTAPSNVYFFPLNSTTLPESGEWSRIGQNIFLDSGFVYTFRWTLEKQASSASTSKTIYIDGLCVQQLNQNSLGFQPYQYPKDVTLLVTETVDVPSISSNSTYTLEVTLNGAEVGDFVQPIYPSELIDLGIIVGVPIVTATNTVKMILHNHSGSSVNPASGDYTFKIVK
jgi:hypothetical protein